MSDNLRDIARELEGHERALIGIALVNMIIFYVFTIAVFLTARKSRVNTALALQKIFWVLIIAFIAMPAYALSTSILPGWARVLLWAALSISAWWVLYEVYRANWHDSMSAYVRHLLCGVLGYCKRPEGE